jgi:hypothetical protein
MCIAKDGENLNKIGEINCIWAFNLNLYMCESGSNMLNEVLNIFSTTIQLAQSRNVSKSNPKISKKVY